MGQAQGTQNQAGAGGYNPQPMQGYNWNTTPGYDLPTPGWQMTRGTSADWQKNQAQGQASLPDSTPQWLKQQMGEYYAQPFTTNPNIYGRWNWGTNLQGGGTPSAFGQYAQQQATYPNLTFPPMPPPAGGGGGGQGQPPAPPPTGGGGGGAPPPPPGGTPGYGGNPTGMETGDLVRQYSYMGSDDPRRAALATELQNRIPSGGIWGTNINQYSAGGPNYDFTKSGQAYQQGMLNSTNPVMQAWLKANPAAAAAMAAGKV